MQDDRHWQHMALTVTCMCADSESIGESVNCDGNEAENQRYGVYLPGHRSDPVFDQRRQPDAHCQPNNGEPTSQVDALRYNVDDNEAGYGNEDKAIESGHHLPCNPGGAIGRWAQSKRHKTECK
jgi:hypothetical protein